VSLLRIPTAPTTCRPPVAVNPGTWVFDALGGFSASFTYALLGGANSSVETMYLFGSTAVVPESATGALVALGLVASRCGAGAAWPNLSGCKTRYPSRRRRGGPSRAAVAFILVTVMLDMLAFGIVIPVLPRLVLDFTGGSATSAAWWQGVFGTVFAVIQFFFAPVLGALSDRFGRRP
jgi:hypothetical protein